jgi:hypothetical protein
LSMADIVIINKSESGAYCISINDAVVPDATQNDVRYLMEELKMIPEYAIGRTTGACATLESMVLSQGEEPPAICGSREDVMECLRSNFGLT